MLVIRMLAAKRTARMIQKRHERMGAEGLGLVGEAGGVDLGVGGGFRPIGLMLDLAAEHPPFVAIVRTNAANATRNFRDSPDYRASEPHRSPPRGEGQSGLTRSIHQM